MVATLEIGGRTETIDVSDELFKLVEARNQPIVLRNASGRQIKLVTAPESLCPWEPTLTREEADRRCAGPKTTLDEILKRLGAE